VSVHKKHNRKGATYQVRFTQADGRQGSRTFLTKKQAIDFDQRMKLARRDGVTSLITPGKKLFRDYALEYLANSEVGAAPRTTARRAGIVRKHLLPAFALHPVTRIDRQTIQQQMNIWAASGLSVFSIRNHRQVLREILGLAVKDRVLPFNPVADVKSPKLPKAQPKFMTPEEFQRLLIAMPQEFQPLVTLAVGTGMRIGEILALNVSDFNHAKGELRIKKAKTEAGVRTVKLGKTLTEVLRKYLEQGNRLGHKGDSPLFVSKRGERIHDSNFRKRVFNPALKRAGLSEFRFHNLRATSSTWMFQQGVPIPAVKDRMGHESIKTTLDHYVIATEVSQQQAVEAIERFFAPEGATFTNPALSSAELIENHVIQGGNKQ
jgi:integrase